MTGVLLLASGFQSWIVPVAALTVSVATFVFSQRELGRRAKVDYVDQIEKRIKECEGDRDALRVEIRGVKEENLDLMRRVMRIENAK